MLRLPVFVQVSLLLGITGALCSARTLAYQITQGSTVSVLSTTTMQEIGAIGLPAPVTYLSLSPDGTKLFTTDGFGGQDLTGLYEASTSKGTVTASFTSGPLVLAGATAVSNDNSTLYAGLGEGSVAVVNIATGQVTQTITSKGIGAQYTPIRMLVSPNGQWLFVLQQYVFCDDCGAISPDQNGIEMIDLSAHRVQQIISTGSGAAMALDGAGANLYFASASNELSVLNLATGTVSRLAQVAAAALAVSDDASTLYVSQSTYFTSQSSDALVALSVETGQTLWTAAVTVTTHGGGLVVNPTSPVAYIVGQTSPGPSGVAVVDLMNGVQTATIRLVAEASSLAVAPDGSTLYAGTVVPDTVLVSDPVSASVVGAIEVPGLPRAAVVSSSGDRAYILYGDGLDLSILAADATTFQRIGTVSLGGEANPYLAISPDGRTLYAEPGTDDSSSIEALSAATLAPEFSVALNAPNVLAGSPDGKYLYVVSAPRSISKVDLSRRKTVGAIALGRSGTPESLAVSADGAKLYVGLLPESPTSQPGIAVIGTSDMTLLHSLPLCATSLALSQNGDDLYGGGCDFPNASGGDFLYQVDTATDTLTATFSFGSDSPTYVTALPGNTSVLLPSSEPLQGGLIIVFSTTSGSEHFIPTGWATPVAVAPGGRAR